MFSEENNFSEFYQLQSAVSKNPQCFFGSVSREILKT